jgi:hypothetical protein
MLEIAFLFLRDLRNSQRSQIRSMLFSFTSLYTIRCVKTRRASLFLFFFFFHYGLLHSHTTLFLCSCWLATNIVVRNLLMHFVVAVNGDIRHVAGYTIEQVK